MTKTGYEKALTPTYIYFLQVGVLEGQNAIKYGIKTQLSPQELVDCAVGKYLNEGCNGGFMTYAFAYVRDHGVSKLSDYPYVGRDETCKASRGTSHTRVTAIYGVKQNEQSLKEAIGKYSALYCLFEQCCFLILYFRTSYFLRSHSSCKIYT